MQAREGLQWIVEKTFFSEHPVYGKQTHEHAYGHMSGRTEKVIRSEHFAPRHKAPRIFASAYLYFRQDKLGPDGAVTPAILNEMKYLKAVQHESQRLLPVINGLGRRIEVGNGCRNTEFQTDR